MKLLGQSFNLMTLGGLAAAVGLVIDDAIVVVENIVLHRDGGRGPLRGDRRARSRRSRVPLIGSTLTPIVVFLPLITITGVTGTFFRALAIAMGVGAADVAGAGARRGRPTLEPLRCIRRGTRRTASRTTRRRPTHGSDAAAMRRCSVYERVARVHGAATRPRSLLVGSAACVVLVAASYCCYRALGSDLLPAMDEGGFILDYVMPAGQLAAGNQPRARAASSRSCARRRKSRARRGAPGCSSDSRR